MIKNEYINKLSERKNSSKERDNFIFGICIGSVLLYYGILNYLQYYHYEKESITYGRLSVIGLVFMIISTIYPNLIDVPYFALRKVISFIGKIVFNIILIVFYFIFVFPVGTIMKLKKENLENTNFKEYVVTKKRKNLKILEIFNYIFNKNYILMLPLIIILIFMGLMLFFAQSSVVAPFIYTIF